MTKENTVNDLNWIRPDGCETNACPEIAPLAEGRVAVRSSKRPYNIAILDADEFEQLRTGIFNFGEPS